MDTAHFGKESLSSSIAQVSTGRLNVGLRHEITIARQRLQRLEAELATRERAALHTPVVPPSKPDSRTLTMVCNALICTILVLPILLGIGALIRRLL